MKRIVCKAAFVFSVIICMIILFANVTISSIQNNGQDCIHHGDVNHDGIITAADAQLAFFIVLGIFVPTYEEICAADCNGDGEVTAADAQAIFEVVLGLGECVHLIPTPTPTPVSMEFVQIQSGTYTRGSPFREPCRLDHEGPQHEVTLTRTFLMMTTEVTRQMWADLKAAHPAPEHTAAVISSQNDHRQPRFCQGSPVLFESQ